MNYLILKIKIFLSSFWWLGLPLITFYLCWKYFTSYQRYKFLTSLDWQSLEVRLPKEILKTPKAMEQIFANLYSVLRKEISFFEKNFKGVVQEWFSFEIVAFNNEIKFFIRTPARFRNLIESQIYAQYPEAEIYLTEDYLENFKSHQLFTEYDFGQILLELEKENPYPILTYPFFEEKEEEKRVDPLANILEALNNLKESQLGFIQILLKPVKEDWKKEGQEIVEALGGGRAPTKMDLIDHIVEWLKNFIQAWFEAPSWGGPKAGEPSDFTKLSPGTIEIIKAIERKISKLGFEIGLRINLLSPKEIFERSQLETIAATFFQFNTQHLNAFKKTNPIKLKHFKFFLKKRRLKMVEKALFEAAKGRAFPSKTFILNSEELATIYHFPTSMVKTPSILRPKAKQVEPPPELPR